MRESWEGAMNLRKMMFLLYIGLILLSACAMQADASDQARQGLMTFFDNLSKGNYEKAAELYGGSYETLVSWNPELNPDDHAALWQGGCQVNGLQCLTVRSATFNERTTAGEYIFTLEFNDPAGDLFTLEGCCGDTTVSPVSQFEYHVVQGGDGKFQVTDMPVYVP